MARYEISRSCGHLETIELFGSRRERDRRAEWEEQQERLCRECWQEKRDREREEEDRAAAAEQLASVREAVEALPKKKPLTREEYEEQLRRLGDDAEDARKAYIRAKAHYDGICDQMRNLRIEWQEQQRATERATEK
ncbi:hypothetical protein [Streptomyces sp. NPDC059631]|uniref:hypothetical protein n=1 Tax=unclassified Streptomyces TaxID=2593676 RepID=UPI0036817667